VVLVIERFHFVKKQQALCQPPNKQLQRTVVRRRGRVSGAVFLFGESIARDVLVAFGFGTRYSFDRDE